jgi:hypothetical protein
LYDGETGCLAPGQAVTDAQASSLAGAVMTERAFTIRLKLDRYAPWQTGPARIVTQSFGPYKRNFMLGQDDDDLVARVRAPLNGNGDQNQAVWTGVFTDAAPLELVVEYRGGQLRLSVNGGPLVPPDHVENVTLVPMATLGHSPLWMSLLVFVPFGFYRHWTTSPAGSHWRGGAAGLSLFLLAMAGAWLGSRYWNVSLRPPLFAGAAVLLVPVVTDLTRRLAARAGVDLCPDRYRE